MKEDKLIRGDAKLKKLPEDRQREIWDKLSTKGETLKSVCTWLADDGLRVSRQTLSEFASWYSLRLTFKEHEGDSLNFMEFARKELPQMSEAKIQRLGNQYFQLQAIKKRDPVLFLDFSTAKHKAEMDQKNFKQRERELVMKQRRVELLEKKLQEAEDRQARLNDAVKKAKEGGLSAEALKEIEAAAKIL